MFGAAGAARSCGMLVAVAERSMRRVTGLVSTSSPLLSKSPNNLAAADMHPPFRILDRDAESAGRIRMDSPIRP
jgi:hypothetical protein